MPQQAPIVAAPDGRVQIDQLDHGKLREAFDPFFEIVELQRLLFPLNELDDLATHQIDRRNQHGHLTGIAAERKCCFSSESEPNPKWKREAARAASARPSSNTSAKCCALPAPPEAITGTRTASETALVSRQSNPSPVPSRSNEVSRISPAPHCSACFAHSTASFPVGFRPPCTKA